MYTKLKKLIIMRKIQEKSRRLEERKNIRKKSRIRETKHLSTDVDSSTEAIGGRTKNI